MHKGFVNFFFIFSLLFIFTFITYGNETSYILKQISTEQLLPGSSVQCVFQDSRGLMWFGIEDVGLCKYDGKKFTIYQKGDSNSISNNFPLTIVEDKKGVLWIGTTDGLNVYNRKTGKFTNFFKSESGKEGIPDNFINDLQVDRYDNVWIATKKGLSKFNRITGKFINLLVGKDSLTGGTPAETNKVFEDKNGNIWIGSYSSGLFKINADINKNNSLQSVNNKLFICKHWLPVRDDDMSVNYSIQQICEFDDDNLLLGKFNGLYLFDHKREKFSKFKITVSPQMYSGSYSVLLKDSRGIIWAGSFTSGLVIIDQKNKKQDYLDAENYLPNGLKSNSIRDIYEDKSGLIWIATKFGGLFTYDKRQEVFNGNALNQLFNNKLGRNFILSLLSDEKNNIWIGTKTNGLFQYITQNGAIVNYKSDNKSPDKLCNNRIECLAEDANHNIWIGTENGINTLDIKTGIFKRYLDYFIRSIVVDKSGNVWIGTNSSGIRYFEIGKGKCDRYALGKYKNTFFSKDFPIRGMEITGDSLLWVSSLQEGLYKYNLVKDELVHFTNIPDDITSLSGNMARAVIQDKNGIIWVSTKLNGLNRFNSSKNNFLQLFRERTHFSNTIYSIVEDNAGNLWMGTHEGLLMYNSFAGSHVLYDEIYGLKNKVYEPNARCKTANGLLIFGGSNGLNVFDPEKVYKSNYKSDLIISSIKVYDKVIAEDINDFAEYVIHFRDKYFSIEFALTDYTDPSKIQYKYKLENFDQDWIESGNRNFASYTSLPPGEYFFNVVAENTDNIWNLKPLRIKIVITSPLWRKPLFVFFSIALLFALFLIFYILRLRFIQKNEIKLKELVRLKTIDLTKVNRELEDHKMHLEQTVKERTIDLEEAKKRAENSDRLKSAFLANMSHEIRTPLNVIIGLSNILLNKEYEEDETDTINKMIETNSRSLLQLINDIIDISKIEANQIKIYKEPFLLNNCIRNIIKSYQNQIDAYRDYHDVALYEVLPNVELFINSDQLRIEQIIKNLINNALKFTKKGSITVGYTIKRQENSKELIQFYVQDTGIGIPDEDLVSVFSRFKKSESLENIKYGGTGLGLSISMNLTRLLEGCMWVESELNKGSVFYFEIPLELSEIETKTENLANVNKNKEYNWENKTILIADDDDGNYRILKNILKQTSVNCIHVKDGISAVTAITEDSENKIDLILMDIKLPLLNGIEACIKIKQFKNSIPVIAQTAYAMDYEEKEILNSGFNGYVSKPILPEVLINEIDRLI
jgi:signal transduction histidine kinase/ligand-binding sensor domain-containing protein/CheY-like chemotaxis protein